MPDKTTYTVGESFNAAGLTLTATYSDGTSKTVTSGFTCSEPDMSTAGTKSVTVTYDGKTTAFNITIKNAATLSSISIRTYPEKTTYTVNEAFSIKGLTLNAVYSDGTTKTITGGFTYSTPDMSTAGTKKVTVTYNGKTTSFNITVNAAEPVYVNATSVDIVIEKNFENTDTAVLSAKVNPANATYKSLVWSSDDPSIASVDENGTVTSGDPGVTYIRVTVTNYDGTVVSDSIEATIEDDSSSSGGIFAMIIAFFLMLLDILLLPFTILFF